MKNKERKVPRGTYKKAIRKFCLECVGNQPKEVKLCTGKDCPLWPYRMGGDFKVGEILEEVKSGKAEELDQA